MSKTKIIIISIIILIIISGFGTGVYITSREGEAEKQRIETVFRRSQFFVSPQGHSNDNWLTEVHNLPELNEGDMFIVDGTVPWDQLQVGMMVLFLNAKQTDQNRQYIVHPLKRKVSDGWITQGYANSQADAAILREDYFAGVVVGVQYKNGKLVRFEK